MKNEHLPLLIDPSLIIKDAVLMTREGDRARILCTNRKDNDGMNVVGLVFRKELNRELVITWSIIGEWCGGNNFDLVAVWSDKPKYPWHLLPPWINWCAINENGRAYGFDNKPNQGNALWIFCDGVSATLNIPPAYAPKLTCDWRDSLVERPK